MGRTKARPMRRTHTGTIVGVGAAAHEASAFPSAASATRNKELSCDDVPPPSTRSTSSSAISPHRHRTHAATVTPSKSDHNAAAIGKKRKFGAGAEDEDDDAIFDQSTPVIASRKILECHEEENVDAASASEKVLVKRRVIFDDDADEGMAGIGMDKECNQFTIAVEGSVTLINVPISSKASACSSDAYELIRFHLLSTKIIPAGDAHDALNTPTIPLATVEAVEKMLTHCNQSLSFDISLDIAPILLSFDDGILDVVLKPMPDKNQVDISIRLVLSSYANQMSTAHLGSRTPPIPIPRKLPGGNSERFTRPHPSYTLLQALGGVFRGSIFDDVAKSLTNPPRKDQLNNFITAKMVYGVVDNAHAKKFEEAGDSDPLDIPGLVPTLHPYQKAAVRWMLKREGKNDADGGRIGYGENSEWELCWYVLVECPGIAAPGDAGPDAFVHSNLLSLPDWRMGKSSPDERRIFCNPFAGWVASSYEEARCLMLGNIENVPFKGGILAESMGLGKTVEVIACILANRSPLRHVFNVPSQIPVETSASSAKVDHNHQKIADHLISKQSRTTKPSAIYDAVCICGRSGSYDDCFSWVLCERCGEAMHGRCAGFESEEELVSKTKEASNFGVRVCSMEKCPSCFAFAIAQNNSTSIIESRATLIVTPPAILTQWQREISRHTMDPATGKPLKVIVYQGIRDLCRSDFSSPHRDFHLVHPRNLGDADVVLATFQALMCDLGHSNDNPFAGVGGRKGCLRSRKRYRVLPSPLTSVKWWRVCLDEAQRVEAPMAASARMARKLITESRWCVSGTPIGRGRIDDLYGLLLFLSLKPFDEKRWFSNSFSLFHGDAIKRLSHLLQGVMWRSTKSNRFVRQQMGIPDQEEKKIILKFSSVEKYFYDRLYEETSGAAHRVMESTKAKNSDLLNRSLQKLRAACCHPQVGTSGIGGRVHRQQGSSMADRVLSMDEILEKLIDDCKAKCEEAQRISTLHTIGLASLTKLKAESAKDLGLLEKSMRLYQEALDLADVNATIIIWPAVLSGSVGFRSNRKTINNGVATLDWQMKSSTEGGSEVWSNIRFVGSSRTVSCLKVMHCTLPPELQGEIASQWTLLRPKECILQMSSTAIGDSFVDACSFTLSENTDAWEEISGFHAKKSKVWRLVIKSYHNDLALHRSPELEPCHFYTGLCLHLFEPEIDVDNLQQLHILHNASFVLSALNQANGSEANVSMKTKLRAMENKGQAIHNNYMAYAHAVHHQTKLRLRSISQTRDRCDKELNDLSEGSCRPWYEDALAWSALNRDDEDCQNLCEAVHHNLSKYYENNDSQFGGASKLDKDGEMLIRHGKFSSFSNVNGLHVALAMRIVQGEEKVGLGRNMDQKKCVKRVLNLSSTPTEGEVQANSHCRRCRKDWHQTGPVCSLCHLEDDIIKFQRLSNDPEIACVLKAISKYVTDCYSKAGSESRTYLQNLCQRASKFFVLQGKVREEIEAAKLAWKGHFDLLSDIDELNQCKRAMRLQQKGEDVSGYGENEVAFIVDPSNIALESMEHEVKQATALAVLRRSKDSLRYLKNKRLERKAEAEVLNQASEIKSSANSNTPETCTVCLVAFDGERTVLPCGHFFHQACVDRIFKRSGGASIRCPMRCPMLVKRQDTLIASEKSKEDGSRIFREISGDWGTKVNRLVGDVMDALQMGDKGIVFSQWDEMLDIVATALEANHVFFIRPKSGKQFGEGIKRFRSSNCPILLMNTKNGAEGLTLTEANHIFMVEPILNCGLDCQAINRIHRIGQASKTYVHRYIVADTIEEKIDAIRMERQENHFEDDLQEQKKHSIKGGGIDGGFDKSELRQLFG